MLCRQFLSALAALLVSIGGLASATAEPDSVGSLSPALRHLAAVTPKVFIISMFTPEAEVWYDAPDLDLLSHNISVPGFSPLFPDAHCTDDFSICQLVTGEGEINAASTISALALSPKFDLRRTYFLIAGVAGVNPRTATIAAATFARYEIQVALQYEIDPRDLPSNFSTGYFPQGSNKPSEYPVSIYGTEVFELNAALRSRAMALVSASNVTLANNADADAYRALYAVEPERYGAATRKPSLLACDGVTSDVYFSGTRLVEAFDNYTTLVTNGTGVFCATGQEDSATLEALVRGAKAGRLDFGRVIAMRTTSDFAAPPPGVSSYGNLRFSHQNALQPAVDNIKIAGMPIVLGVVREWNRTYAAGIKAGNYIGDILGTLGGKPDFGPAERNDNPIKRDFAYTAMKSRGRSWLPGYKTSALPILRVA